MALSVALEAKTNIEYNEFAETVSGTFTFGRRPVVISRSTVIGAYIHFALFAGAFGFFSMIALVFAEFARKLHIYIKLGLASLNFIFLLTAFAYLASSILFSSGFQDICDAYSSYSGSDIWVTWCGLPRAVLAFDILSW
jgi:hypothetical protein